MTRNWISGLALLILLLPVAVHAGWNNERLEILVDGEPRPEHRLGDSVYIEALRGREYSIRLTNPSNERVAVALSVDGLNTIDARHTDARSASKWVLDPWESVEISGWQVSEKSARRFLFTGERSSYGAALGQTENLGVIEAIWFRERRPRFTPRLQGRDSADPGGRSKSEASGESRERAASAPQVEGQSADTSDDYAATGMGDRMRHGVERVHLELESTPLASVRLRYEFRPQLVELGIFPDRLTVRDRRGRARGFDGWCPEP